MKIMGFETTTKQILGMGKIEYEERLQIFLTSQHLKTEGKGVTRLNYTKF
jgi:hypothetical protein